MATAIARIALPWCGLIPLGTFSRWAEERTRSVMEGWRSGRLLGADVIDAVPSG